MSNIREKISAELAIQASHEGETANIAGCRLVLRHVSTTQELQALVSIQHHRYGKLSYEAHRFYYLREWVAPMAAELAACLSA